MLKGRTHINVFVLWEDFIKVRQEFDDMLLCLSSLCREVVKDIVEEAYDVHGLNIFIRAGVREARAGGLVNCFNVRRTPQKYVVDDIPNTIVVYSSQPPSFT